MGAFDSLLQDRNPVQRLLQQFTPGPNTFGPSPLSPLSLAQRAQDLAAPKLATLDRLVQQAVSTAPPDAFGTRFESFTPDTSYVRPPASLTGDWNVYHDLSKGGFSNGNPWSSALDAMAKAAAKARFDATYPAASTSGSPATGGNSGGVLQYKDLLLKASQESGVPWQLLAAFMQQESSGQNLAANSAGAEGVMQVVPSIWQGTADKYGGNLMDPWTSIRTAADIISQNYKQYGNWDDAIHAYYGWGVDPSGPSGADYVKQVKALWDQYNQGQDIQAPNPTAASVIQTAMGFFGTPYMLGGMGPGGFDCSGLTQYAFAHSGIYIPRTAQEQYDATTRVSYDQAQAGDLIFFTGTNPDSPNYITHVGIYLGGGKMLQAGSDGVTVSDISDQYWLDHFVSFGHVKT